MDCGYFGRGDLCYLVMLSLMWFMLIRVLVGDWYYNGWLCLVCVLDCMDIVVKEEFKVYIDLLIVDEYDVLECSILVEGCCDVLVLWGDVLVDGYNCYGICCKYNFLF